MRIYFLAFSFFTSLSLSRSNGCEFVAFLGHASAAAYHLLFVCVCVCVRVPLMYRTHSLAYSLSMCVRVSVSCFITTHADSCFRRAFTACAHPVTITFYALCSCSFARKFTGSTTEASSASGCVPTAALTYDEVGVAVVASLTNAAAAGSDACVFSMVDNAYGGSGGPWKVTVAPGATQTQSVSVAASAQWYDLTVNVTSSAVWSRRFMGHMENGRVTTSDPAVGTPLHPWVEPAQHPLVPDEHINYKIEMVVGAAAHKDAVVFANYALLE